MLGAIASILRSIAAATNWMPPAYEPPCMPTRGSRLRSSLASGWRASQFSSARTSRPSFLR